MPSPGPDWSVSPRGWRALIDYDQWDDAYTPDDGVALHHGGSSDYEAHRPPYRVAKEIQQLQQWEGFHIYGRGWRGIAYGWAVGQSGAVYRLRGWNTYGAHTGDHDGDLVSNNKEIIPILFVGSGSRVRLTISAQNSVARLRRYIEANAPKARRLYGHTEVSGNTSCPGAFGMEYVRANRLLPEEEDIMATIEELRTVVREETGLATWGGSYTINGRHPNTVLRAVEARVDAVFGLLKQVAQGVTLTPAAIEELEAQLSETWGIIERDVA